MALYALDVEKIISADVAADRGNYRCLECRGPLQVRQGRRRRHFYHVRKTPSCRLYSKSEDHLVLQYQIQALFAQGEIILEKPFLSIGRVADACLERWKLIFEIQCSPILRKETEARIQDYGSLGYTVVWLLDDRLFNRKSISSVETFLRTYPCYFIRYQRQNLSFFYDQFEILQGQKRLKKGICLPIFLGRPRILPKKSLEIELPEQILKRFTNSHFFFEGDLCHKALLSPQNRSLAIAMQNWAFLERQEALSKKDSSKEWEKFLPPLYFFFEWVLSKVNT